MYDVRKFKTVTMIFVLIGSASALAETNCYCGPHPSHYKEQSQSQTCKGDNEGLCITIFEGIHASHGGACSFKDDSTPGLGTIVD